MDAWIRSPTATRVCLPMLVTGTPHELRWNGGTIKLRQPGENERLIAGIGDRFGDAEALFPGKRLVPIKLDASGFVTRPAGGVGNAGCDSAGCRDVRSRQRWRVSDPPCWLGGSDAGRHRRKSTGHTLAVAARWIALWYAVFSDRGAELMMW